MIALADLRADVQEILSYLSEEDDEEEEEDH